jgi:hypothetical protein
VSTQSLSDDDSSIEDEFSQIEIQQESNPYKLEQHYALFDSGATAHFLVQGEPVINKQLNNNPLQIKLSDAVGSFVQLTNACNLNIPCLPNTSVT